MATSEGMELNLAAFVKRLDGFTIEEQFRLRMSLKERIGTDFEGVNRGVTLVTYYFWMEKKD